MKKVDPFWNGFNERCAEYGLDPNALFKTAGPLSNLMMKLWGPKPNMAAEYSAQELRAKRRGVTSGPTALPSTHSNIANNPGGAAAQNFVAAVNRAKNIASARGATVIPGAPGQPRVPEQ